VRRAALPLLALAALALAGCGGRSDKPAQNLTRCEQVEQPELSEEGDRKPPEDKLDLKKTYKAIVETSCGNFTITLAPASAPNAVASFVALAKDGFYEGIPFHRVVPGFVIQGGDPTGTGAGGPGYVSNDRMPTFASYTRGIVAMWKSADQPPGTAGSQFFVVAAPDAGLPPQYAIIGRVTAGFDAVRRIGRLGDAATQQPRRPVVIRSITVTETTRS
jgi:peptidyl-prolyl cis-trans isomerase B (cyclophilin B)